MAKKILLSIALCLISAVLLALSFPQTNWNLLAFVGLVPFLMVCETESPRRAGLWGYLTGLVFFLMMFYWFVYVTPAGAALLIMYLSVYFALFAVGVSYFAKGNRILKIFLLPSIWVVCEYLRGHLLSGFNWASLAHSQYQNLVFIQISDLTGMAGVSFLIVLVNVYITQTLQCYRRRKVGSLPHLWVSVTVFISLFLVFIYGAKRLTAEVQGSQMRIAIVQANTPQEIKWVPRAWPSIMNDYLSLTREASQVDPDLIIWPETSYPGLAWETPETFEQLKNFQRLLRVPLLVGMVHRVGGDYYNSAVLIREGLIRQAYHKLHLVPFGEYVPFRKFLPFLSAIVQIDDFTAGKNYAMFSLPLRQGALPKTHARLNALICFEDTVESLARAFALKGSELFINMTNDAWFNDTKAPFVHLAASVFRAVENRRWLLRVANTGVSCFIDSKGRVVSYIENDFGKKTFVSGWQAQDVSLQREQTFYTKFGDVFTTLCLCVILGGIIEKQRINQRG